MLSHSNSVFQNDDDVSLAFLKIQFVILFSLLLPGDQLTEQFEKKSRNLDSHWQRCRYLDVRNAADKCQVGSFIFRCQKHDH